MAPKPIDLFRLYILFSQYKSCDNTQEDWFVVLGKQNVQAKRVYCRIAHILGILLMNSCNTDIFFSNYYHLQSVRFEYVFARVWILQNMVRHFVTHKQVMKANKRHPI